MTQRPQRSNNAASVGALFERMRNQERLHHGPWIYVGSGDPLPDGLTSPPFQNGFSNSGGGKQTLRFRWTRGGGIDIEGSVKGGALGLVVFTLPNDDLYRDSSADGSKRRPASDDAGGFVVYTIMLNGDVIYGPA